MKISIIAEKDNIRIDKYLADKYNLSRAQISRNIKNYNIKVNRKKVKNSYKINIGDIIEGEIEEESIELIPEEIKLDIVYEDEYMIAVNKEYNMVVHPCISTKSGTLVNALMNYTSELSNYGGETRRGIVHRLDKDTTGLILIAKNDDIHQKLSDLFKKRDVIKKYHAIVHGCPKLNNDLIDKPIGRDKNNRTKMTVTNLNSKRAISEYKVLNSNGDYSLLEIRIYTGRTHQIRVHMSYIGNPILGDPVYGRKKEKINTKHQMLHSYYLGFNHPIKNEFINLYAKPDKFFIETLSKLNLRYDYE